MILAALALAVIAARRPDAVLLDLRMPGGDGLETLRALPPGSAGRPRFLVLTTYDTYRDISSALRAGADGFLLKDAPRSALLDAAHRIARGEPVLAPRALGVIAGAEGPALTGREIDVLREIASGGTNAEAAARLFISETTLTSHLGHVFDKLGVGDRAAAVRVAFERGLL